MRFGLTPEQIGDQTWTEPVTGRLRMMRPPGTYWSSILPLSRALSWVELVLFQEESRGGSILEWVLLKPEVLKKFLARMERQEGFRKFYMNLYDMLRLAHRRIFDEKAPEIEELNETLNTGVLNDLETERRTLEAEEAWVFSRKGRINWLVGLTEDWELKERF